MATDSRASALHPEPLELTLELLRLDRPAQAHGRARGVQEYALRRGRGSYDDAVFAWDDEVAALLDRLQGTPPDRDAAVALAERLQRMLDEVGWGGAGEAIAEARAEGRVVLITVVAAGDELYALPFELLVVDGEQLVGSDDLLLRYELPGRRQTVVEEAARVRVEPGRVLVAWSDVGGGPVGGRRHYLAVREVLAAAGREGVAEAPAVERLAGASEQSLKRTLDQADAAGQPFRILHLVCHGAVLTVQDQPAFGLALDDEDDPEGTVLAPDRIAALLAPYAATLRLVILEVCHGSSTGEPGSRVGSVAQALHAAGIQSVLASRYVLSTRGAHALTASLYDALVRHRSLESALVRARAAMARDGQGLDDVALQLYAQRAAERLDTRPLTVRPYRGLAAYQPDDARFLFGRDDELALLVERVQAHADAPDEQPGLMVLTGPSGAGKSSVVRGGLVPALAARGWTHCIVRAGEGAAARAAVAEALREADEEPLLVVVDQLEELGRRLEPEAAAALAGWLLQVVAERAGQVVVVGTMRTDQLGVLSLLEVDGVPLDRRLEDQPGPAGGWLLNLASMGPDQLRAVVDGPARLVGLRFADELVGQILAELGETAGGLPLLSYALDRLWAERSGPVLDGQTYAAIGGVAGALGRTAEDWRQGLSSAAEQAQADRILRRLVDLRTEGRGLVRRRLWVDEERPPSAGDAKAYDAVIADLVQRRLLVAGRVELDGAEEPVPWVELAHEALITHWQDLQQLVARSAESGAWNQQLEEWAHEWRTARAQGESGERWLLEGEDLARALRSAAASEGQDALGEAVLALVDVSQRRATRRQRITRGLGAFGLAAVVLVSLSMGVLGLRASRQAQRAGDALRLGLASEVMERDPTLAAAWLSEVEGSETSAKWLELASRLSELPVARMQMDEVRSFAWAEGDRLLVDRMGDTLGWVDPTGAAAWQPLPPTQKPLRAVLAYIAQFMPRELGLSPDGRFLATTERADLVLASTDDGSVVTSLDLDRQRGADVAFRWAHQRPLLAASDGRSLFVVDAEAKDSDEATLIELRTRRPLALAGWWLDDAGLDLTDDRGATWSLSLAEGTPRPRLRSVQVHRDPVAGRLLAIGSEGRAWLHPAPEDAGPAGEPERLDVPFAVREAWLAGGRIIAAGDDGALWQRVADDRLGQHLPAAQAMVTSAALSAEGDVALLGDADGRLLTLTTEGRVRQVTTIDAGVEDITVAPDDRGFAVLSRTGRLVLVGADGTEVQALPVPSAVMAHAFSPSGAWMATVSADAVLHTWPTEGPGETTWQAPAADAMVSVAFSQDRRRVVTLGLSDEVRVLDTASGGLLWEGFPLEDATSVAIDDAGCHVLAWTSEGEGGIVRVDVDDVSDGAHPLDPGAEVEKATFLPGPHGDAGPRSVVWTSLGRVWLELPGELPPLVLFLPGPIRDLAVSAAGDRLAVVNDRGEAMLLNTTSSTAGVIARASGMRSVSVGADALVWLSSDGGELVDLRTGRSRSPVVFPRAIGASRQMAWSRQAAPSPFAFRFGMVLVRVMAGMPLASDMLEPGGGATLVTTATGLVFRVDHHDGSVTLEAEASGPPLWVDHARDVGWTVAGVTDVLKLFSFIQGWPMQTRLEVIAPGGGPPLLRLPPVAGAAVAPDGSGVVTVEPDGALRHWKVQAGEVRAGVSARTRACVGVERRVDALGQQPSAAQAQLEACEAELVDAELVEAAGSR